MNCFPLLSCSGVHITILLSLKLSLVQCSPKSLNKAITCSLKQYSTNLIPFCLMLLFNWFKYDSHLPDYAMSGEQAGIMPYTIVISKCLTWGCIWSRGSVNTYSDSYLIDMLNHSFLFPRIRY